jgi:hypothetical protein
MSVLAELRALEHLVVARMKELRPLIDEYVSLSRSLNALDCVPTMRERVDQTPRQTRRRSHGRIAQRAGGAKIATATSAGEATSSTERFASKPRSRSVSTSLERVVHRLEEQGAMNKRGRELRPPYAHSVRARFTSGVLSLET